MRQKSWSVMAVGVWARAREAFAASRNRRPKTALSREKLSMLCFQRIAKILDDIVRCFDADGEPDQTVRDAELPPRLGCHSGMRSGCGPGNQRLDASKARSVDRQRRPAYEPLCILDTAF